MHALKLVISPIWKEIWPPRQRSRNYWLIWAKSDDHLWSPKSASWSTEHQRKSRFGGDFQNGFQSDFALHDIWNFQKNFFLIQIKNHSVSMFSFKTVKMIIFWLFFIFLRILSTFPSESFLISENQFWAFYSCHYCDHFLSFWTMFFSPISTIIPLWIHFWKFWWKNISQAKLLCTEIHICTKILGFSTNTSSNPPNWSNYLV